MQNVLYKDIDISFKSHPITGDVLGKSDEESIKQSVRTLILTNVYERVMHPEKGSQIFGLLFENNTPLTKIAIKDCIISVLKQYEPRIAIKNIQINYSNGEYDIVIWFSIIDFQQTVKIAILLNKVR